MTVNEFDVVLLNDGNEATIVEILDKDKFFIADIDYDNGKRTETEQIPIDRIKKIIWKYSNLK